MNQQQKDRYYLAFGVFTNPGLYKQRLIDELPSDIRQIGLLVRKNIIHRTTLAAGNTGTNADLRFGDMTSVPWWRQPEDDILITTPAMLAELSRRDERGLRSKKVTADHFHNASGNSGAVVVAWSLFYDFHALMNHENIYLHIPEMVRLHNFPKHDSCAVETY